MQLWGLLASSKFAGWLSGWIFRQKVTFQCSVARQSGGRLL